MGREFDEKRRKALCGGRHALHHHGATVHPDITSPGVLP